jgi:hypothetical protein
MPTSLIEPVDHVMVHCALQRWPALPQPLDRCKHRLANNSLQGRPSCLHQQGHALACVDSTFNDMVDVLLCIAMQVKMVMVWKGHLRGLVLRVG